jgi:glycosyltransferase involved in cell wall biosynthesis
MAQQDDSIQVHGFVDDVRPYFADAGVAICPIRDGGGTRVKILDNLAMARPIVSTSIGIEGIDAVPERDLLVADNPEAFVQQITRVFENPGLRQSLADNARRLAETRYSWDGIGAAMLAAFDRAASCGRSTADGN